MSASATKRGLLLPCPMCGETGASVSLQLSDMDTLHCGDCDTDFTVADVRYLIDQWTPVLAWVELAPKKGSA